MTRFSTTQTDSFENISVSRHTVDVSMDKLTSSNRDPTLAVTSSIPVPCAAVSFPAMILSRRWVWDLQ